VAAEIAEQVRARGIGVWYLFGEIPSSQQVNRGWAAVRLFARLKQAAEGGVMAPEVSEEAASRGGVVSWRALFFTDTQ